MPSSRSAGILLHPTSLPGPDGIGDLGPEAYRWVSFLVESGCSLWQILPLGPTGFGDSPYQCFSAFAGNPYLVSPFLLLDEGLLAPEDLTDRPALPAGRVDYGPAIQWKLAILDRAFARFRETAPKELTFEFRKFQAENAGWLDNFALFMSIKESQEGNPWNTWPAPLRLRKTAALLSFSQEHVQNIRSHAFRQFLFFRQWSALRAYAHGKGISVIGDVPIYVAYDSAEVWSHPELFHLNQQGRPTVVAGVPPDYFSPTGQLWGNPIYRWDVHQETDYAWWIERVRATLALVDYIRMDHFRGFAAGWQVPAKEITAEKGEWVPGPGRELFEHLRKALGSLPIIAEDLGEITPDVIALRDELDLPGMKVLQFAFGDGPEHAFLPHNYTRNCVAYTGTHDNDTSVGWYASATEKERDLARRYLARSGEDIAWDLIRAVWGSVADTAIAPLQDFLSLDSSARMNYPGRAAGNWTWRYPPHALNDVLKARIFETNYLYSRSAEHLQSHQTS